MPKNTRRRDPFDATLAEIRRLTVWRPCLISDDTDQWWAHNTGRSPRDERDANILSHMAQGRAMVLELIQVGEPAVPAAAKAFRMQGVWREELLPFVEAFRKHPVMRGTLKLVAERRIDPLAQPARRLLKGRKPLLSKEGSFPRRG